ncbi:response regulator [bacterium]|nr:response regulator [bacterium]MBP9808194.1 response regulator [bacterium]
METPKLLIAGLSQQTLNLVRQAVEQLGYQIVPSPAMSLALFLAHKNLPDIIISDLHMRDGDGLSFLREIQQDEDLKAIPFIFCFDQMPDEVTELQAIKSGARKVVPNSLDPFEFLQIIEPLIDERLRDKVKRQEQSPE